MILHDIILAIYVLYVLYVVVSCSEVPSCSEPFPLVPLVLNRPDLFWGLVATTIGILVEQHGQTRC